MIYVTWCKHARQVSRNNSRLRCFFFSVLFPKRKKVNRKSFDFYAETVLHFFPIQVSKTSVEKYLSRGHYQSSHQPPERVYLLSRQWQPNLLKTSAYFKDGAYYCYCAYVLRISRYSDFPSPMLTNTGIFLRGLKLSGESRS